MTKKPKQPKKAAKNSKRTKVSAQPEDETDTATTFSPAEAPESLSVGPQTEAAEVPVESQQATEVAAPATQVTDSEAAPNQLGAMQQRQTSRKDCGCIKSRDALPRCNLFSCSEPRVTQ